MKIFKIEQYDDRIIIQLIGIKFSIKYKVYKKFLRRIKDLRNINKFLNSKVRKKSVLIVEPNAFHGEILPGFVKYFQDLGYNVDLLLRHENVEDSSLINIKNYKVYSLNAIKIKEVLKFSKINDYEFLFISTTSYIERNIFNGFYLNYLNFVPKSKRGILLVEHTFDETNKQREIEYVEQNKVFTLSGYDNTPILNPHYFTDVKNHIKNSKTKFLISGHCVKGNELLIKTVDTLIKDGIENFEIRVLGSRINVPKELKKYFKIMGYVKFKTLYKELENADYILPMLDEFDKNHKLYLNGTTSGARQQSLGFLKPLLINEKFAAAYDFDNSNAVIYEGNNLYEAMKTAIEMTQDSYTQMQVSLNKLATDIYNKSLDNLRKVVVNNEK